jgi:ABC-type spermidine/putrescine transport system permease subunit I
MRQRSAFLLIAPGALLVGGAFLFPFAFLLMTSFWAQRPGSLLYDETFTLANYLRIATDPFFVVAMLRTIALGLATVAICLVLGLPIARWIARRANRSRGLLIVLVVMPLVCGALIQTLGLVQLLSLLGVVNGALKALGLIDGSIHFLGNEFGILIGLVQAFLPLMVLPLTTVLAKLPVELEEAASSLGAPAAKVWRHVILPLSVPGIVAGSVLVFFAAVTSFVTPQILGQGRVSTFGTMMYQQAALVNDWPFASALAVTMLVVLAAVWLVIMGWTRARAPVPA